MNLLPKQIRQTLHPLGFVGYVRSLVLRGAVVHVLILAITAASNWKKSPSTRSDLRRGEISMGKIDDRHLPHLKLTAIFAP